MSEPTTAVAFGLLHPDGAVTAHATTTAGSTATGRITGDPDPDGFAARFAGLAERADRDGVSTSMRSRRVGAVRITGIIGTGLPRRILPHITPARSGVGAHLHVGTIGLSASVTIATEGNR
jgi:hypothetical protein